MAGQRAEFSVRGEEYETLAEGLLHKFSVPYRVHWERDYGVDFYCLVKERFGQVFRSQGLFVLQVGGPGKLVEYGGVRDGKARSHEIEWLKSLTVPLFFGRVSWPPLLELFSMSAIWRVLIQTQDPFRITCVLRDPSATPVVAQDVFKRASKVDERFGDGMEWEADLGPPVISVPFQDLGRDEFVSTTLDILRAALALDWRTITWLQSRIAFSECLRAWATNDLASFQVAQYMAWNRTPGANIPELLAALAPALMNLGASLQWQHDRAAYDLIPALELVRNRGGYRSGLLDGLLRNLCDTRDKGLPPSGDRP